MISPHLFISFRELEDEEWLDHNFFGFANERNVIISSFFFPRLIQHLAMKKVSLAQKSCVPLLFIFAVLVGLASCSSHHEQPKPMAAVDPSMISYSDSSTSAGFDQARSGMCDKKRYNLLNMTDGEIIEKASNGDMGNCKYEDATHCRNCACLAYVKIKSAQWRGQGWPIDPDNSDSTGCVSAKCWSGYKSKMCATNDLKKNGAQQLRDALNSSQDICGLCDKHRKINIDISEKK